MQNKLNEFYYQNVIKYSEYDNLENQLKIFFGNDFILKMILRI